MNSNIYIKKQFKPNGNKYDYIRQEINKQMSIIDKYKIYKWFNEIKSDLLSINIYKYSFQYTVVFCGLLGSYFLTKIFFTK